MHTDKLVPVTSLPPVRFISGPKKQGRTGNIQKAWDPDRSASVVTDVGVPVEESLSNIGMNTRSASFIMWLCVRLDKVTRRNMANP